MVFKRSEAGYTFVSHLLSLLTILIMMPVIILLLQIIRFGPDNSQIDAQQFFDYLHTEALVTERVEIDQSKNRLIYKKGPEDEFEFDTTVKFEQYKNRIRRTVNNGNEIYLRSVDTFQITPVSYGFRVKLMMENGEVYEKTIEHNTTRK